VGEHVVLGLAQPEERNAAAMTDEGRTIPLSNVITIDESGSKDALTGCFAAQLRRR
jgi:hypothetical protein